MREVRRSALAAILGAAAVLAASSMLGVASAEAPAPTPVRTVSVEGVAEAPIAQGSSREAATAAYRQAMAAAMADGQSKAEYLVGKAAGTLGSVQSIAEGGGSIECHEGEEHYVEYEGQQPDFGSVVGGGYVGELSAPTAAPRGTAHSVAPTPKPKKKHKKATAKAAAYPGATCTLSAQVTLVYAIG